MAAASGPSLNVNENDSYYIVALRVLQEFYVAIAHAARTKAGKASQEPHDYAGWHTVTAVRHFPRQASSANMTGY